MADPADDDAAGEREDADPDRGSDAVEQADLEALREQVEAEYDFEEFGPADMAEMEREEWEAVFDPDTWITGPELVDRVERDLRRRIATREVFARLERHPGPDGDRLLAWGRDRGCERVRLSVHADNDAARSFYAARGFDVKFSRLHREF